MINNRVLVFAVALLLIGLESRLTLANRLPVQRVEDVKTSGTAFVVNPDGYLLTAAHVVRRAASLSVVLGDRTYSATVVSISQHRDLALLRINATGLPALPIGDSSKTQIGEEARVFGFPLKGVLGESLKVTRGVISGIDTTEDQKFIQVDAAVNAGNSGGPLANERGEVIGVILAKLTGSAISNVGFALPVNEAKSFLRDSHVQFTTSKGMQPLDGPSLVRQVSPQVALVIATRRTSVTLTGFQGAVTSLAFSPDGAMVATASRDRTTKLWDTDTGHLLRTLENPGEEVFQVGIPEVRSVAFSPDGTLLATTASLRGKGAVHLWDPRTGHFLRTLGKPGGEVQSVAFSPDGTMIAIGRSGEVHLWDTRAAKLLYTLRSDERVNYDIFTLAFSPDGATLASTGLWGRTNLWDVRTRQLRRTERGSSGADKELNFSPDGTLLARTNISTIEVYDASTGRLKWTIEREKILFRYDLNKGYEFLIQDRGSKKEIKIALSTRYIFCLA
jgi:S1-C subfamily serine protease